MALRHGAGVLDHWDTIQVPAANLQHGLLSQMDPEFVPVWGYAGRRRHPMLAANAGALWLL